MLAAIFITGGVNTLKSPQGGVLAARPVLDAVGPAIDTAVEIAPIDHRPDDEMLVKIDAGVKIVAGGLLALGKFPRLASTVLAASLIPTTLAGHRYWEEADEQKRAQQQIHFFKNVGLLGGLLIAAADTHGKPSMAWRGRQAAQLASASASEAAGRFTGTAQQTSGSVAGLTAAGLAGLAPGAARASRAGSELSSRAIDLSADWSKRAAKAAAKAEKRGNKLQKLAAKRGAELQKRAAKRGAELQKRGAKRAAELQKHGAALQKAAEKKRRELEKRAPGIIDQVTSQASKLGHDVAARASTVGAEVAHQAGGAAKDARKRVAAFSG